MARMGYLQELVRQVGMDPRWNMFRVFAELFFHSNLSSSYVRNSPHGYAQQGGTDLAPLKGATCEVSSLVWQPSAGPGRAELSPGQTRRRVRSGLAIAMDTRGCTLGIFSRFSISTIDLGTLV